MTDIIFKKETYKEMHIYGFKPNEDDDQIVKDLHITNVKRILAHRLKTYLNYCIKEKTRLMYN